MAFDSTSAVAARTPLMEIDLGGTTLRYSDRNISLSDGTHYEARILSFPSILISLGWLLDSEFRRPSILVVLDNADDALSTLFNENDGFVNKAITLKVGHGTTASNFETRFVGCRRFPGGIKWDEGRFQMQIEWDLQADMRVLPRNKFDFATYPRAEEKARSQAVPWIYGDWRSTVTENQKVRCYQINQHEGVGGRFKIAQELQSIEQVYKNGVAATYIVSGSDEVNGEFVLGEDYNPSTDTIEAHVLGATTATFAGAGAEFSLPRLAYDLLTNSKLLGLSSSRINVAAFAAWENELHSNSVGRRWIGAETAGAVLLAEIMTDGQADLYLNNSNLYTPVFRKREVAGGIPTFREGDLAPHTGGGRHFSVQVDPEGTYANEIVGDYARQPHLIGNFANSITDSSPTAISNTGTVKRRRLRMNWLYTAAAAGPRTQTELATYSREVQTIKIRLGPPGLTLAPTDQFKLDYSNFANSSGGTSFQVRDVLYDFSAMEAEITAWNLNALTSGFWSSGSAPNWATASTSQRSSQGFWTDGNGLADPADSTSNNSRWF